MNTWVAEKADVSLPPGMPDRAAIAAFGCPLSEVGLARVYSDEAKAASAA